MEEITIDYTTQLNQIYELINNQNILIQNIESSLQVFTFLMVSSIAIILGIMLVKD
jgi:hypothetical protein